MRYSYILKIRKIFYIDSTRFNVCVCMCVLYLDEIDYFKWMFLNRCDKSIIWYDSYLFRAKSSEKNRLNDHIADHFVVFSLFNFPIPTPNTWSYCFHSNARITYNALDPFPSSYYNFIYMFKHCFNLFLFFYTIKIEEKSLHDIFSASAIVFIV